MGIMGEIHRQVTEVCEACSKHDVIKTTCKDCRIQVKVEDKLVVLSDEPKKIVAVKNIKEV